MQTTRRMKVFQLLVNNKPMWYSEENVMNAVQVERNIYACATLSYYKINFSKDYVPITHKMNTSSVLTRESDSIVVCKTPSYQESIPSIQQLMSQRSYLPSFRNEMMGGKSEISLPKLNERYDY